MDIVLQVHSFQFVSTLLLTRLVGWCYVEEENLMTKPLDGLALQAYCRRLGFSQKAQELIATIRTSPPNRNPHANHGNMPVWYPSTKMQCVIKAESHKVEFAFLLEAEYGDAVVEYYDQPSPPIQLSYLDKHGRRQTPFHTADY